MQASYESLLVQAGASINVGSRAKDWMSGKALVPPSAANSLPVSKCDPHGKTRAYRRLVTFSVELADCIGTTDVIRETKMWTARAHCAWRPQRL